MQVGSHAANQMVLGLRGEATKWCLAWWSHTYISQHLRSLQLLTMHKAARLGTCGGQFAMVALGCGDAAAQSSP